MMRIMEFRRISIFGLQDENGPWVEILFTDPKGILYAFRFPVEEVRQWLPFFEEVCRK